MLDAEAASRGVAAIDNSGFANGYKACKLPLDSEGYVTAFEPSDAEGIKTFFDRYGVVVIQNVLNPDQCHASVDAIWDFIERHISYVQAPQSVALSPTPHPPPFVPAASKVDRSDATTWDSWTSLAKLGFLGDLMTLSPQLCDNRQNPNLHAAFAAVLGTERLIVSVGRAAFMRPTRRVKVRVDDAGSSTTAASDATPAADSGTGGGGGAGGGAGADAATAPTGSDTAAGWKVVDKPEWKTVAKWLHYDLCPHTGRVTAYTWRTKSHAANAGYDHMPSAVQGLVALADAPEGAGGFICVPGMAKHLRGWAAEHPECFDASRVNSFGSIRIPDGDDLHNHTQRVPVRAGSAIIWSSATPHANFPNDSHLPRIVQVGYIDFGVVMLVLTHTCGAVLQYIKMVPADSPSMGSLFTDETLLPDGFKLSPLGQRLHGFKPWS